MSWIEWVESSERGSWFPNAYRSWFGTWGLELMLENLSRWCVRYCFDAWRSCVDVSISERPKVDCLLWHYCNVQKRIHLSGISRGCIYSFWGGMELGIEFSREAYFIHGVNLTNVILYVAVFLTVWKWIAVWLRMVSMTSSTSIVTDECVLYCGLCE
jgi:hypothetical protein